MSSLIASVLSYLLLYTYVTLFIVAFLAALIAPLPSSASLMTAAVFASQGYLNVYLVLIVAIAGNILGDMSGFLISRRYGKGFLNSVGLRKILASKKYTELEGLIARHSGYTIFATRFIGGAGPVVNILTGLTHTIPVKKFILFGILGETTYVLSLVVSGYYLGSTWETITANLQYVSIGVALIIGGIVTYKLYTKATRTATV